MFILELLNLQNQASPARPDGTIQPGDAVFANVIVRIIDPAFVETERGPRSVVVTLKSAVLQQGAQSSERLGDLRIGQMRSACVGFANRSDSPRPSLGQGDAARETEQRERREEYVSGACHGGSCLAGCRAECDSEFILGSRWFCGG